MLLRMETANSVLDDIFELVCWWQVSSANTAPFRHRLPISLLSPDDGDDPTEELKLNIQRACVRTRSRVKAIRAKVCVYVCVRAFVHAYQLGTALLV